jgi:hypothetical protein
VEMMIMMIMMAMVVVVQQGKTKRDETRKES